MDIGFYKRATRGIRHKAAMPFYPRKPAAQVAPAAPAQQGGGKAKQPAADTTVRSVPAPPPSAVMAMEVGNGGMVPGTGGGGAGGETDVDSRAALYISRVQERLRRERMVDDWRKYY